MRITLATETYAPQVNGVSRTLGQLARHLREAGDEVQLVHPDYGLAATGPNDRLVRAPALPFYPEVRLPLPILGKTWRAIDEFAPDLIHVATEATLGLGILNHAENRRIPIVSSFHTNFDQYVEHYRVGWARGPIWRYLRWFHNRTRETYVPSRPTISDLQARGFERLVLWPRGVDARLFRPDRSARDATRAALGFGPDDLVIGHVSRLAAEKNVGHLADALRIVVDARPGVRLLFVGDGPARAGLEAALGSSARFVGYRSGEDLADHYAAADLFAFASTTETLGNVVLEAMATALPVVALRAGGVAEVVRDGSTGILVAPADPPDAMAAALLVLIDDPERRRAYSRTAREYASTQSWFTIMSGLRARYLAILEPARPAASNLA